MNRRQFLRTTAIGGAAVSGIGGSAATVTASDADFSGGDRIWSFETGGGVESSPTVVDKTAYFGSNDGNVYAVDAETGTERWRFETDDPPDYQRYNEAAVSASPKVVDGTVYIGAYDNNFYALDAETGDEQWRFEADRFIWGSAAIAEGVVYVPSRAHHLHALDSQTGDELWRGNVEHPSGAHVAAVNGLVHVGSYGDVNFHTFDAETGDLLWEKEFNSEQCAGAVVHDGLVYAVFNDRPFYAFDAETGAVEWEFDGDGILSDDFGINETPTVWNDTVYISNRDRLYAIEAATGDHEWTFEKGQMIDQTPTVADGVLFIGSHAETALFAIDADTGEELWRFETFANIYGSPTVVDGVVFFGSHDGYLHAVAAGVEGSSEDKLLEQGTEAHHHSFAGEPEPSLEMEADDEPYEAFDGEFEPPYGEWFDGVPNFDGTVDWRGRDSVTITVGAGPNGMQFDPPAVLVDPGIDITFEWTGEGAHDVVEETGLWESSVTDEAGSEFSLDYSTLSTGDTRLGTHGVHRYYCTPHRTEGMRGVIAVGDAAEVIDDIEATASSVPGFGVLSALAGVGAASYLLQRQQSTETDQ